MTESINSSAEPVDGDNKNATNADANESQEINGDTDEETETVDGNEPADETEDIENPSQAVREVTVKFENCKNAKHARTTIPYGSNIYDVFKKLVETGVYDGMVTTEKYNFDGWEITISDSIEIKGANTELIKQYVEKGGLNIPANGNVTCNAHWSRK